MTDTRRPIGVALIVGAAVLAAVGVLLWGAAADDAEEERLAAEYEQAILLDQGETALAATVDTDPQPDRTAAIVVLVLAGAAGLAGVVTLARTPRPAPG